MNETKFWELQMTLFGYHPVSDITHGVSNNTYSVSNITHKRVKLIKFARYILQMISIEISMEASEDLLVVVLW